MNSFLNLNISNLINILEQNLIMIQTQHIVERLILLMILVNVYQANANHIECGESPTVKYKNLAKSLGSFLSN